jgi:ASC-1-like (ASCH) protein
MRLDPKHLSEPWFSLVATGKKVFEGRLGNSSLASEASAGTEITFFNDDLPGRRRQATVVVTGKKSFPSFRAMLGSVPKALEKTLPTVKSVGDGVAVYRAFYTAEEERRHGVVRLRLRLLDR